MARISSEALDELKRSTSLVALVEKAGIELKNHGKDLVGRCPFHDDKTPSLVITPDKNLWHCMGACQQGGSAIDWVMKFEGVSFKHAVELLKAGLPHLAADRPVKKATVPKLGQELRESLLSSHDHQEALQQVIDYYHKTLKDSPNALEYLAKRGLNDPELVNHFKLGYANRTLGLRLPHKNRKAGEESRGKLTDIGILRSSGHEHFNGALVVPIINPQGQVTEVYGRKIVSHLRQGTVYHLYLPGPHQGVFNEAALQHSDEVILCESLIDAMTFWCNGFRNVTASYGTSGFTQDHLTAFKQNQIKKVLIAYDNDAAGNKAAFKLVDQLNQHDIYCARLEFPTGADANEFGLGHDAQEAFISLVASAKNVGKSKVVPIPTAPSTEEPKKISDHEITFEFAHRRYRIRGLHKNLSYDQLRINLLVAYEDRFFVDTFDLYNAKQRTLFIRQAVLEVGYDEVILSRDLGRILLKLEELQDAHIQGTLKPKRAEVELSPEDHAEALAFLKSPDLIQRILADFERTGLVGEATNKLVGYLAAISRKLDKPLALMVQSASASGKSSLMDAVLAFVPEEERIQYSAMTGQSLFYMGQGDLKHKILAIAEEEGIAQASYALKVLQSDGKLNIASTNKDPNTGKLVTTEYAVEGPVMIFLTTTAIDIDEELLNRCMVLTVTETREQTEAIHRMQREQETLEGLLAKQDKVSILNLHKNAQRLIKPLAVVNPFAKELTFSSHQTRARRDHMKYLSLIKTITLLHQYQREVKTIQHQGQAVEYIEVTLDDIKLANHLAQEVLKRSLDELPPQTRTLLTLIQQMVQEESRKQGLNPTDYRFSRRDIRAYTNWGNTQTKIHCQRLEEMEYLLTQRVGRSHVIQYELIDHLNHCSHRNLNINLIEAEKLNYDPSRSGQTASRSPRSRPEVGAVSARCRGGQNEPSQSAPTSLADSLLKTEKTHRSLENHTILSYS